MTDLLSMLGLNKTASRMEFFPTFKFHVEIGSIMEAAFTDCSGLEMSTDFKEYAEGGNNSFVHVFPGRTKYSHVTLKRGYLLSNDIFQWYQEMETCIRQGKPLKFRSVSIILTSTSHSGSIRWNLNNAFPIKWTGPSLKTSEAAVATESLEFAHHGITSDSSSGSGTDLSQIFNISLSL